jgi:hypothetical protein
MHRKELPDETTALGMKVTIELNESIFDTVASGVSARCQKTVVFV